MESLNELIDYSKSLSKRLSLLDDSVSTIVTSLYNDYSDNMKEGITGEQKISPEGLIFELKNTLDYQSGRIGNLENNILDLQVKLGMVVNTEKSR